MLCVLQKILGHYIPVGALKVNKENKVDDQEDERQLRVLGREVYLKKWHKEL